jgi:hypothetical protein
MINVYLLLDLKMSQKAYLEYDLEYDCCFLPYYFPKIINLQQKYF